MRRRLRLLLLPLALGVWAGINADENRDPQQLDQVLLEKTGLAWDGRGNAVTVRWDNGEVRLWNRRGTLDKTCLVDPGLSAEILTGMVGLNDDRALFAASRGDHLSLNVYDVSRCRLLERRVLPGFAVMAVQPAKNGWLLQTLALSDRSGKVFEIDRSGRPAGSWTIPDDLALDDSQSAIPGRWAVPIDVDGDVWLIPQASYRFVRPRQRGKGDYEFRPPSCLASAARAFSEEEARSHSKAQIESSEGTSIRRVFEAIEKSPSKKTVAMAVVGAAASGSRVAVLVRDAAGECRVDIWDLTSEKLLAAEHVGSCNTAISFRDERLTYFADRTLKHIDMDLAEALDEPCRPPTRPKATSAAGAQPLQ